MRSIFAYDILKRKPTDTVAAGAALKGRYFKLFNPWLQTIQVIPGFVKLLELYVLSNSLIPKWGLH